jgi:hypothetical protein
MIRAVVNKPQRDSKPEAAPSQGSDAGEAGAAGADGGEGVDTVQGQARWVENDDGSITYYF